MPISSLADKDIKIRKIREKSRKLTMMYVSEYDITTYFRLFSYVILKSGFFPDSNNALVASTLLSFAASIKSISNTAIDVYWC